jgi:hypothetical protein
MPISETVLAGDVPSAAYAAAVRVLDEFNALATEYARLLDAQRTLLAARDFAAVVRIAARGDVLARRAEACGRQLSALDDAMWNAGYAGPRTRTLRVRMAQARARADMAGAAAANVASACAAERDAAATALGVGQAPQHGYQGHVTSGVPSALDTSG